jgi:hypothetical protein
MVCSGAPGERRLAIVTRESCDANATVVPLGCQALACTQPAQVYSASTEPNCGSAPNGVCRPAASTPLTHALTIRALQSAQPVASSSALGAHETASTVDSCLRKCLETQKLLAASK